MSRRPIVALLLLSTLGAVACTESDEGAQTVRVLVDSEPGDTGAAFNRYFPSEVTVRPGDSVEFESSYNGQPHTVTLGTLVDAGLPGFLASPASPPPPELAKIPFLLEQVDRFEAIQGAAQPCYLRTGDPPTEACTPDQQKQPEFNGSHTYYNSGFLPDDTRFTVTVAEDTKPGTYQFFCLVHRIMTGKITVAGPGQPAQTPDEVTRAGTDERNQLLQALQPGATALRSGAIIPPLIPSAPGTVFAGTGMPNPNNGFPIIGVGEIDEFGPREITVPVGSTVTWPSIGAHTVSFNADRALQDYIVKEPSGFVRVNPRTFAADGGPQPPPTSGAVRPPPLPVVDGGRWDGTGYRSSGMLFYTVYTLTFTRPGTYGYVCLIHPQMQGVVRVA
jgi:plastocyanin